MKVKFLRTIGKKDTLPRDNENPKSLALPAKRDGSMYRENEVADVSEDDGQKFLSSGVAELVAGAK